MNFITDFAELGQTAEPNYWYTKHNQLFKDQDGVIYLVPRYFITDGYTIPDWIAWLGGGKMKWDTRPAIGHDFDCKFHQCIRVILTEEELRRRRFLRTHKKQFGDDTYLITVCDDIPIDYLAIEPVTFNQANSKFKRMMKATGNIKNWRINLMRAAVNLNIGWLKSGKEKIDLNKIYKGYI